MKTKEIWKAVPGWKGKFEVSNLGRVRNLNTKKIRKCIVNATGYVKVKLTYGKSKKKQFRLHRLIAEVFIPNPYNKEIVRHKDNIKHNNRASNLEWGTMHENEMDKYKNQPEDKTTFKQSLRLLEKSIKRKLL